MSRTFINELRGTKASPDENIGSILIIGTILGLQLWQAGGLSKRGGAHDLWKLFRARGHSEGDNLARCFLPRDFMVDH